MEDSPKESALDPEIDIDLKIVPSQGFKRAHDRFTLRLLIAAEILIPEDTFRPHSLSGKTHDISAGGMKIELDALPKELYVKLLARPRHIRVALENKARNEKVKVTGKIAWIDYHKSRSGDANGRCEMGVRLREEDGINLNDYKRFLDDLQPIRKGARSGEAA